MTHSHNSSPLTPYPEPMPAPICSYNLEVEGQGEWVLGYQYRPPHESFPAEHMAFAAKKTGEGEVQMHTLERMRHIDEGNPYIGFPADMRDKVPPKLVAMMELIADAAHVMEQDKPEQTVSLTTSTENGMWDIGMMRDEAGKFAAYATSLEDEGPVYEVSRPVNTDDLQLDPPEANFGKAEIESGELPQGVYNVMTAIASTAGYRELAEHVISRDAEPKTQEKEGLGPHAANEKRREAERGKGSELGA